MPAPGKGVDKEQVSEAPANKKDAKNSQMFKASRPAWQKG